MGIEAKAHPLDICPVPSTAYSVRFHVTWKCGILIFLSTPTAIRMLSLSEIQGSDANDLSAFMFIVRLYSFGLYSSTSALNTFKRLMPHGAFQTRTP